MKEGSIAELAGFWGIRYRRVCSEIEIPGSPERCLQRCVIEDETQRLFVLEKIAPQALNHKKRICNALQDLFDRGLTAVHPYLRGPTGQALVEKDDGCYQIMPYIRGIALTRPDYTADGWRGTVMADFLLTLRQIGDVRSYRNEPFFSIVAYIEEFMAILKDREPGVYEALVPVRSFLNERFTSLHDQLPVAFCHGDFHPLNIIWGRDCIRGVIDWEFAGYKPEIYDLALLIGCIGSEDPDALIGELVLNFIRVLREKGQISPQSWAVLPEFVVAIRFAWMSEWLRKKDTEMIELEMAYLDLLMANAESIKKTWYSEIEKGA